MILNIYKPIGLTSFAVVKQIRNILNEKVGHGGTLDPFAEGVLVLGTGKDTKTLSKISNSNKTYTALIRLGKTTNTLDPEGRITEKKKIPSLNRALISEALQSFQGETLQEPPMFSAKKIAGKKLYKLARKNIVVKRNPVKVTIREIELINFTDSTIKITTTCSKGTYIRVLGSDIAKKLGTVGYLEKLIRTRVGEFILENSKTIENFRLSCKSSDH